MRLVLATHTYWPEVNGVAEVVRQIATRLAARGHEVHVATQYRPGFRPAEVVGGVQVTRFDVRGNGLTGVRGEVERYRRFVEDGRWEALEIHCAQSWPLDALAEGLGRVRARKIFVGHGLSQFRNPAWAGYFEGLGRVVSEFDRVVALSTRLEEMDLCREANLPPPAIVPNAVDLEEWNRDTLGVRAAWGIRPGPWLVSVSNHSPVKGHDALFDVIRGVAEVENAVSAAIIGGPYPAERWRLGRFGVRGGCWYTCRARALWKRRVSLQVVRPRGEVVSAVKEADVLLVTSVREAAPLTILEAQAAETPWVAFDVGSIRENAGGIVVDSRHQMIESVLALLRDRRRANAVAAEGRAAAIARGGWDRIAIRHERLCRGDE
jgi:glycosyltransferase involved in cell wall biosynthesis